MTSPSKDIVEKPELWVYTDDFGKCHGDSCFIAVVDNQIVGAVWTRIMNDYGHMDVIHHPLPFRFTKIIVVWVIGTGLMKELRFVATG